jgi:hypothetical protein
MSALVLVGLLLVGAKPSKPVSLPMPPPPAVKPKPPPEPEAAPAPAPAAEVKAETPKHAAGERTLLSKLRLSGGVGPGFSLSSGGTTIQGVNNPIWLRGTLRATLDLAHVGPGDLQAMVPISLQGTAFRWNFLGVIIAGSMFGADVMPSARYQAEVLPDLSLFAELGLGFGIFQVTIQQQFVGYQSAGAGGFGVRVGAGIEYRVLDQIRLLVQPLELTALTVSSTTTQNGQTITTTGNASQFSMIFGAAVSL